MEAVGVNDRIHIGSRNWTVDLESLSAPRCCRESCDIWSADWRNPEHKLIVHPSPSLFMARVALKYARLDFFFSRFYQACLEPKPCKPDPTAGMEASLLKSTTPSVKKITLDVFRSMSRQKVFLNWDRKLVCRSVPFRRVLISGWVRRAVVHHFGPPCTPSSSAILSFMFSLMFLPTHWSSKCDEPDQSRGGVWWWPNAVPIRIQPQINLLIIRLNGWNILRVYENPKFLSHLYRCLGYSIVVTDFFRSPNFNWVSVFFTEVMPIFPVNNTVKKLFSFFKKRKKLSMEIGVLQAANESENHFWSAIPPIWFLKFKTEIQCHL